MPTRRHYVNDSPATTLSGTINSAVTTMVVASLTGFPVVYPYTAVIDRTNPATAEVVLVTGAVSTTLTITRGYDGTTAQSHTSGVNVEHVASAIDYDEANAHTVATSGVHGVTGSVVGTSDSQTLSAKTLTTPAVTTPAITAGGTWAGGPVFSGGGSWAGGPTLSGSPILQASGNGSGATKAASFRDSTGAEKAYVSDVGDWVGFNSYVYGRINMQDIVTNEAARNALTAVGGRQVLLTNPTGRIPGRPRLDVYDAGAAAWRTANDWKGIRYRLTRAGTSDNFAANTMTTLFSVTPDSTWPTGEWMVSVSVVLGCSAGATGSANLRILDSAANNLTGDVDIGPSNFFSGAKFPVTWTDGFTHTNGNVQPVLMAFKMGGGTGTVYNVGAVMNVWFVGPS